MNLRKMILPMGFVPLAVCFLASAVATQAETTLLYNGIVHTGSGDTFTNGGVLIEDGRISLVLDGKSSKRLTVRQMIDLKQQHVYPGLIAMDSVLGLSEIEAVRATQDATEVGEYTPDVESWIAVNPDSELLPVARANGIAYFEPVPKGGVVAGQSGLVAMEGWTSEQRTIKKPVALHVYWPAMQLNTLPRESFRDSSRWKSLDEQVKDRRAKVRTTEDFFEEAKAYAKAKEAAGKGAAGAPEKIPAWEAMLPYVRGELPIVVHADELRQITSAVQWAATNHYRIFIAGGRDAALVAGLLASNNVPVIFEDTLTPPVRDTDSYDVQFSAPEVLRKAGVKVVFGVGPDSFTTPMARNLPYTAAHAIAFGLPENEALKGLTLYPAQLLGVADRLGSIEPGKEATLFVSDGSIFDVRANVKRLWIAGREVSLETRHTRLYERYKNRPK
jgi:imidazolonepropionase-like amidohydrolase